MNKYHAHATELDGYRFDSKAEAARYGELKVMEQAGEIGGLVVHPALVIVDKDEHGRAVVYKADFSYIENLLYIIEDLKGGKATQTPLWRLKWRLAQARYPEYTFRVVER